MNEDDESILADVAAAEDASEDCPIVDGALIESIEVNAVFFSDVEDTKFCVDDVESDASTSLLEVDAVLLVDFQVDAGVDKGEKIVAAVDVHVEVVVHDTSVLLDVISSAVKMYTFVIDFFRMTIV